MRIGELAGIVGVSTRTVRHYHRTGVLPEPTRRANGYREYDLRDAVALARARRLAGLGLSLDEIRDVLAVGGSGTGGELREILTGLDADLAAQQRDIAERRDRLAELLADPDLGPDSAVSPRMAAVLNVLPDGSGSRPGSRFAEFDREMLTLVDAVAGDADRDRVAAMLEPLADAEAQAMAEALYARLDALADADADDPRVGELARDLAAHVPDEMAAMMREQPGDASWLDEVPGGLSPAQARALRLMIDLVRVRCP
ncbi:MerR family transcriptional regulator [Actinomadura harenae]|uniref:MerR family transcriptional regulator n=1 Tax=Actinomadura harenae TaxID=2483351 RepID=A0A3M2LV14_9ACTN|nr:MerR family transcriptional regulator [Actinomadura harenae]RMI41197.1 MerR family transcriptional regulator [Actinomadura harenae]